MAIPRVALGLVFASEAGLGGLHSSWKGRRSLRISARIRGYRRANTAVLHEALPPVLGLAAEARWFAALDLVVRPEGFLKYTFGSR